VFLRKPRRFRRISSGFAAIKREPAGIFWKRRREIALFSGAICRFFAKNYEKYVKVFDFFAIMFYFKENPQR